MLRNSDEMISTIGCINPVVEYTNPDRNNLKLYKCGHN